LHENALFSRLLKYTADLYSTPQLNVHAGSQVNGREVKNQPFHRRFRFAFAGLLLTLHGENSFRTHVLAAIVVFGVLVWRRPAPMWWAVLILTMTIVLALELVNTALEHLSDHLHPDQHPRIKVVKDCAAAAVLVASIGAIGVAIAFIFDQCKL
jgi:undecaprenol kinase